MLVNPLSVSVVILRSHGTSILCPSRNITQMYIVYFQVYTWPNIAPSYLVCRNFVMERFSFRLRNLSDVNKWYSCSHSQMTLKICKFSKITLRKVLRRTRKGTLKGLKGYYYRLLIKLLTSVFVKYVIGQMV